MTPKETSSLHHFLTAFDAQTLGEGDEVAGINLLAAMSISLANLARPGSGILTPEGTVLRVGCNLLASGSLTTNMILDGVVTPVGGCQDNFLSHLDRLLKDDKAEGNRGLPRRWTLANGPPANSGENSLVRLMTGDPEMEPLIGSHEEEWLEVLGSAPSGRLGDLVRRPRVFIAGATAGLLDQQLPGVHDGHALVVVGLNRASDVAKFGDLCPALMGGMIPAGPAGETVRGRLLVTDPGGVLPMAAKATGDKTTWLARLLWLVDGYAGPELPSGDGGDGTVRLPSLGARFEHAVRLILAHRLNSRKREPLILEFDFADTQARWMSFLADMERSLPGIRGTARCLLASLVFGLRRLVGAAEEPKDFRYYHEGIEAFARLLVQRMANARAAMLYSAEEAWKLRQKRKILAKLAEGPLDTRSIYRPRIPADLCRELLAELVSDSCVRHRGGKWERIEGSDLPDPPAGNLPFEV